MRIHQIRKRGICNSTIKFRESSFSWPQRWSQIPTRVVEDLTETSRKMLVHYPKDLQSLNKFAMSISAPAQNTGHQIPKKNRLYSKILAKYKKDLFRNQCINAYCHNFKVSLSPKTVSTLNIVSDDDASTNVLETIFRSIQLPQNIKVFRLQLQSMPSWVTKSLKYVRSVKSIYINLHSTLPCQHYKRLLSNVSSSLELLTLIGDLTESASRRQDNIFRIINKLPNLKRFNLDALTLDDLNDIPFDTLDERNISFNIRVTSYQEDLTLSKPNELGLSSLEFLGINFKKMWREKECECSKLQKHRLKIEEKSRKVLIVNFLGSKQPDLSPLLGSCKNIKALSIALSTYDSSSSEVSFVGLKTLANLKHAFIQIEDAPPDEEEQNNRHVSDYSKTDLLENLIVCSKNIKSFSFLCFEYLPERFISQIQELFKGAANSLTHVALSLGKISNHTWLLLKILNQLEFLEIRSCDSMHAIQGTILALNPVIQNLRELSLSKLNNIEAILPNIQNLEKLRIEFWISEKMIFTLLSQLQNLKHLEMFLWFFKIECSAILAKLLSLQTFKLKKYYLPKTEIDDFEIAMKNHKNLELIALGHKEKLDVVYTFTRGKRDWTDDINFFFAEDIESIARIIHKPYSF